jgi:hypothetical protein
MSKGPVASLASDLFPTRAEHPFGDLEYVSGRTRAPFSRALLAAADNLLAKADRALTNGDPDRARLFIDRAAALDYDAHEQAAPAAFAATMMVFTTVTDTLERSLEGDSRWLDAAVETLSSADGWGKSEMGHTLLAIRQDYVLDPGERDTIGIAVAKVPERAQLRDSTLPPKELAMAVTSALQTVQKYRTATTGTEA